MKSLKDNTFGHKPTKWLIKNIGFLRFIHFWNYLFFSKHIVFERQLRREIKLLEGRSTIVDIGCGDGQNLLSLARTFPDHQFIGLDKSKSSLDLVQKYCEYAKIKNVSTQYVDLEQELDLPPGQIYYSNAVFPYVRNPKLYDGLRMNIKKGCLLCLHQPVNGIHELSFLKWLKSRYITYDDQNSGIVESYSEFFLKIDRAGFNVQKQITSKGKAGRIGFELYFVPLIVLVNQKMILSIFFWSIIVLLLCPLSLLLQLVDFLHKPSPEKANAIFLVLN
ncbi:class I SAM-dependent methyltransferase [Cryomorphaceae bacterium]|nr:class I SAM-dependent methyltransferase [Cryomorphaceae bacterium]